MQTPVRAWHPAGRALACGAFIVMCCGIAVWLAGTYPTEDNALFEYCGRAILRGQHMYRDIWDDKLPGIYYVNALWQLAFGERYLLHTFAQTVVALVSGWLLFRIIRDFSLPGAQIAACALIAWLCILFPLNSTEAYALPFMLASVCALVERKYIATGICIGLATAFWIPSVLMLIPAITLGNLSRSGIATVLATSLAIPIVIVVLFVGNNHAVQLAHTWLTYSSTSPQTRLHRHIKLLNRLGAAPQAIDNLRLGLLRSGVAGLALVLAAVAQRGKPNAAQRFGIIWTATMMAGAFVGTRFFAHYFVGTVPALVFTTCAYGSAAQLTALRKFIVALAVLTLGVTLVMRFGDDGRVRSEVARRLAYSAGPVVAGHLTLFVDSYKPELYLALDPVLRTPYEVVGATQRAMFNPWQKTAKPDVVVQTIAGGFLGTQVCAATARPWRMFVRPSLQGKFLRCR